ncbi:MAG: O-methyltransferase [Candidatus Zixiibacteriota bacterium]
MFEQIHTYLEKETPARPPVLAEMEGYAAEHDFPIVGPLVGRFLYQLASLNKAKKVFEMGSGFGYSAYWFSLAVKGRGHIIMTDTNKANRRIAFDYFKRAGLQSRIDFKTGNALSIIKKMEGPFDIILNDIDKQDYPKTVDLAASRLRKGGLFISDNLIWSGKVCQESPDKATRAIVEFTRALYRDSRFFTTIMPVRDGIAVAVRQ